MKRNYNVDIMATDKLVETQNLIDTQIKMLERADKESERLLSRNKLCELQKHLQNIEMRLEKIQELKYRAQGGGGGEEEETAVIDDYTDRLNENTARFDVLVADVERAISRLNEGEEAKARYREDEEQEAVFKRRFEEEMRLEEMRLEMRKKYDREEGKDTVKESVKVKLPKLVISKFEGTALDWFRFWNQFETEVDKQDISPVTKFSYLKEFLIPHVRRSIDGLPFTSEGYARAKSILLGKFGKPSIVANAHIKCITSLPVVKGSHPNPIHDFYEKLSLSVQALDTMKKVGEINGYVRITLDKLPGIRADLVRLDDDWQEWGFNQFLEALRKWTERNPKFLGTPEKYPKRENVYHSKEKEQKPRVCVYCDKEGHKSSDCETVSKIADRRVILSQ